MVLYCNPCEDKTARHTRITSATVRAVGPKKDHFEVVVHTPDGRSDGIDLAYTYVRAGGPGYRNLASLVRCRATDVPERIDRDGNEI